MHFTFSSLTIALVATIVSIMPIAIHAQSCRQLQIDYTIVPMVSWGSLSDASLQDWWNSNSCNSNSNLLDCKVLQSTYGINVGTSWGTLADASLQKWWSAKGCDSVVGTITSAAAASPLKAAAAPASNAITGSMTWYTPNGGTGACWTMGGISNNENAIAMNHVQYDASWCGKQICISYNGKTTTAIVKDLCPDGVCGYGHLDSTPGVWNSLGADMSMGVINSGLTWWQC